MTTPMVFPQAEKGSTLGNIFFNQGGSNLGYKKGSFFGCKKQFFLSLLLCLEIICLQQHNSLLRQREGSISIKCVNKDAPYVAPVTQAFGGRR